jgi:crotonobetainyl-CoA:carnitine CoA-transferase CaiB-like acyl-CoA transferase
MNARPLDDVVVVDLSRFISGPLCARLLADLGAQVIKVETGSGDPSRKEGPFVEGLSLYYAQMNRGKEVVWVDLRSDDGPERLWSLIDRADVVIENFRPGTLAKMGFGPDKIHGRNPRCILASVAGFPRTSTRAGHGAFDEVIQAVSGLASLTGDAADFPLLLGAHVVDVTTGILAATGVLAALQGRSRSGMGTFVTTTLLDGALTLMGPLVAGAAHGDVPSRTRNRDRTAAPADTFEASDGWVYVHAGGDGLWRGAAAAMGREDLLDDPRFGSDMDRLVDREPLEAIVAEWVRTRTVEDVERTFTAHGVLAAAVNTLPTALADASLGIADKLDAPVDGEHPSVRVLGSPIEIREFESTDSGPGVVS